MKVLHIEDSFPDAELTRDVICSEWPGSTINVVCSRPDFVRALAEGGNDLILSDFNMQNFNGLEALQLARAQAPEIPFIFLSGTIGEDRAIEAMRSGATDYVIKDRPKRLVPAMKRALEIVEHRRERRAVEEQLLRVQRLENIGMLAAGIAHDFNNVLTPVLMAVPLLRDRLSEQRDRQILNNVERSAERGAGLVREILGFVHGVTGEPELLQPKHLLRDLLNVIRQTFPSAIQVDDEIQGALWPVKANPTQLHQVLLNLCVNARDAMPNGGTLRLSARNRSFDAAAAAVVPDLRAGAYVVFEVSDTGTGIPPGVLQQIWEPFFTTKGVGRGTGLGLSTVRAIVKQHEGTVVLRSQLGVGTTFEVYLPATAGAVISDVTPARPAVPRGNSELVLVVDDDAEVRDVAAAILIHNGYRVLAAAHGVEAVSLFAPRSLEVRVVLTDLSMPHLDGVALAQILRNLNPSLRILSMSGLADQQERIRREQPQSAFLAKPFTSDQLLESIHGLLQLVDVAAP